MPVRSASALAVREHQSEAPCRSPVGFILYRLPRGCGSRKNGLERDLHIDRHGGLKSGPAFARPAPSKFRICCLKVQEALSDSAEIGKVIGRQDLPLDDGEVDFDLVEPTGMNRRMHERESGIEIP